jgi:hypothetical protein
MNHQGLPLLRKDEALSMRETHINTWLDLTDEIFASLALYKEMVIPPNKLLELCTEPLFEKAILHFYVQVTVGRESSSHNPVCRFCRIEGVEESEKEYYEVDILQSTVCT